MTIRQRRAALRRELKDRGHTQREIARLLADFAATADGFINDLDTEFCAEVCAEALEEAGSSHPIREGD